MNIGEISLVLLGLMCALLIGMILEEWLREKNICPKCIHGKMAKSVVRVVRDAVISYNEMFPVAPNDDAERELRERARIANDWLEFYGFDKEPFDYYEKKEQVK